MREIHVALGSFLLCAAIAGCSSPGDALIAELSSLRPSPATFCTAACSDARTTSCADWASPDLTGNGIEACLRAECTSEPLCEGSGNRWEFDCYVGCVSRETEIVQRRVLENTRCDIPPACR